MTNNTPLFLRTKTSSIFLLLSVIVFTFWVLTKIIENVYHYPVVGAIFEIFWLPVIALTLVVPVLSLIKWRKEKFNLRSLNFYSILIIIFTVLMVIFVQ